MAASSPCDCGAPMLAVEWVVALAVIVVIGSAIAAAVARRHLRSKGGADGGDESAVQLERS